MAEPSPDEILQRVLVLRCQTGDGRALEELYLRHSARLGYYLRRLLDGDDAAAADVQQDVWLTVVRTIGRLRTPAAFTVWLYRVARTRAMDRLAASGNGRVTLEADAAPGAMERAADDAEAEFTPEDAAAIHAALGRIGRAQRDVLLLRFMEDLSYEQIAEVTGCPFGTVASRLHHAKQALRRELEKQR
jgi:RNA polymerase sigma-70 factor (ECF subfamily)